MPADLLKAVLLADYELLLVWLFGLLVVLEPINLAPLAKSYADLGQRCAA